MNRNCIASIVVGVALLAGARADAIVLRYEPKEGSVRKYKASMAGRMQTSMGEIGDGLQMEMTVEQRYEEKVLARTENGVKAETKLVSGEVTVDVNGQSQTIATPAGRVVTEMDDRGRVLKLVEVDFESATGLSQFGGGSGENFPNWSQFGAFPEGDVEVGDSWTDTLSVPTPSGGMSLELTFTSRLLKLEARKGHQCAKIQTSFEGPMKFDLPEGAGAEASLEATLGGEMLWYYDYENSVYVYGEGAIEMSMTMSMPMPGDAGGEMTTKARMNIKTAVVE
jgi:hypothetical protein